MATKDQDKQARVPGNDAEVDVNTLDDQDLIVEIADDTPPEDKGRKALEHDPLEKKDSDDEAVQYTKGVKKRINELTHKAHDERRRAERAEREKEEAVRFAQAQFQRARMLEAQLTQGEAAFAGTTLEKEQLAVTTAQDKYKKAYESGDPDAIATATAEIAAASQRLEQARHWSAQAKNRQQSSLQNQNVDVDSQPRDVNTQPRQAQPEEPDSTAIEWSEKNEWFGKNRKMTSYVYGIHEELTHERGLHPVRDAEEYYAAIDKEMRERFPDYDWGETSVDTSDNDDDDDDKPAKKPAAKKPASSVVAPVTRTTSGNGKKVTLTESEVRIAKSFGLTPQEYAREKLKLNKGA